MPKQKTSVRLETTVESDSCPICPWDEPAIALSTAKVVASPPAAAKGAITVDSGKFAATVVPEASPPLSICPCEQDATSKESVGAIKSNSRWSTSTTSDITEISNRMQRNLGIRHQNTVDNGEAGMKRLIPNFTEQRRASVSFTSSSSRLSDQFGRPSAMSAKMVPAALATTATMTTTLTMPSSIVDQSQSLNIFQQIRSQNQNAVKAHSQLPAFFYKATDVKESQVSITSIGSVSNNATATIATEPPLPLASASISNIDDEDELCKLHLEDIQSTTQLISCLLQETTSLPFTNITPSPNESNAAAAATATEVHIATLCNPSAEDMSKSVEENQEESTKAEMNMSEVTTDANPNDDTTEVLPLVKEVQIELIETLKHENKEYNQTLKLQQLEVVVIMPPITLHESQEEEIMQHSKQLSDTMLDTVMTTVRKNTSPSAAGTTTISVAGSVLDKNKCTEEAESPIPEDVDGYTAAPEELSPTTDEYEEGLQFGGDDRDVYDYDIVDTDTPIGDYTPPAPTPALSLAPLAELDVDTVDDELAEDFGLDGGAGAVSVFYPDVAAASVTDAGTCVSVGAGTEAIMYTEVKYIYEEVTQSNVDETRRRRKKRNLESKKISSLDKDKEKNKRKEKDKNKEKDRARDSSSCASGAAGTKDSTDRNTICPWEDENVNTSNDTFVKTYATLGYL